jgi:thiol-disulfide isomerase/thioredoxin
MNRIILSLTTLLLIVACNKNPEPKDYVTLTGKITNKLDSTISITGQKINKIIKLNDDGIFKDTLKVTDGYFVLSNGVARTIVELKNGYNLEVLFDADNIVKSTEYSGIGAGINNYMAAKMQLEQEFDLNNIQGFFEVEKEVFDEKLSTVKYKMQNLLDGAEGLDSTFANNEIEGNKRFVDYLGSNYEAQHAILAPVAKGKPSPKFNYPDINGKYVSLNDLKGKYVYIDIWATWCAPCKKEIPFLKELDKTYKGKNIAFVSLSIDKQENKDKWISMVKEQNLTGIQILSDNDWNSEFIRNYGISAIPRFILIDTEGKIISNNAPRPSDQNLNVLLDSLSI